MTDFSWDDRSNWPQAPKQYVFLADAFHKVGAALYPGKWTGAEAADLATPTADLLKQIEDGERRAANHLRAQQVQPAARLGRGGSFATQAAPIPAMPPQPHSAHVATRARHLIKTKAEEEEAAARLHVARRLAVAEWIADKGRNSEIETYGLWIGGRTPLIDISPAVWNGSSVWALFARCRVSITQQWPRPASSYFLFVGRDSLGACLSTIEPLEPEEKKPHPSSLAAADAPLIEEMRELILAGTVSGPNPAALRVVDRAAGGGELDAKVRRLEKRYQKTYPG
jgi:hypothetical protein